MTTITTLSRSHDGDRAPRLSQREAMAKNAPVALRWTARRLKAYKHLLVLTVLAAHQCKYLTQRAEHDADAA